MTTKKEGNQKKKITLFAIGFLFLISLSFLSFAQDYYNPFSENAVAVLSSHGHGNPPKDNLCDGVTCGSCQGCNPANGLCESTCSNSQDCCGSQCIDTQNDRLNCGSCGYACPDGYSCREGNCEINCNDYCLQHEAALGGQCHSGRNALGNPSNDCNLYDRIGGGAPIAAGGINFWNAGSQAMCDPNACCCFVGIGISTPTETNSCEDGDTQQRACGFSVVGECSAGVVTRTCVNGEWPDWPANPDDPPACVGAIYPAGEVCNDGLDNDCDGTTDCADLDCRLDPVCLCTPGDQKALPCGVNNIGMCRLGTSTSTCQADGTWSAWTACMGNIDPAPEICNDGRDNNCDGFTDCADNACIGTPVCGCTPGDTKNQACGSDVGLCVAGQQFSTCNADGTWGPWSVCNDVGPQPAENCVAAGDEDCNGFTNCEDPACAFDPACGCIAGDVENRACGMNVGECRLGNQQRICAADGTWNVWGACVGGVNPVPEICNDGRDNDCDGLTDCNDPDCLFDPACVAPGCGDAILDPGEECDDGCLLGIAFLCEAVDNGDGCSAACALEAANPGSCGDGKIDPGEDCDDGNTVDGDLCSSICTFNQCVEAYTIRTTGISEDIINPTQETYSLNKLIEDDIEINGTLGSVDDYYLSDYRGLCADDKATQASSTSCSYTAGNTIDCSVTLSSSFSYFDNIMTFYGCAKIDGQWYTSLPEYLIVPTFCGDGKVSGSETCDGTPGCVPPGQPNECQCEPSFYNNGPNSCGEIYINTTPLSEDITSPTLDTYSLNKLVDDNIVITNLGLSSTGVQDYYLSDFTINCNDAHTNEAANTFCSYSSGNFIDCGITLDANFNYFDNLIAYRGCVKLDNNWIYSPPEYLIIETYCGDGKVSGSEICDGSEGCIPAGQPGECTACINGYYFDGSTCLPNIYINTTPLSEDITNATLENYSIDKVINDSIVISNRFGRSVDDYYLGDYRLGLPAYNCTDYAVAENSECYHIGADIIDCNITLNSSFTYFDNLISFYGCAEIDGVWYQSPAEYLNVTTSCGDGKVSGSEICDGSEGCIPAGQPGECTACIDGYYFDGNSCQPNIYTNTTPLSEDINNPTITTYSSGKIIDDNINISNRFGRQYVGSYMADYRAGLPGNDCSDGFAAAGASCIPGLTASGAGELVDCQIQLGNDFSVFDTLLVYYGCSLIDGRWYQSPPEYLIVESLCGDGKVSGSEACDDGCNQGAAGVCEVGIDDGDGCTYDCKLDSCGDGICSVGEHPSSCPVDCPNPNCGDSICSTIDNPATCEIDCSTCDRDGICEPGEHYLECPDDCRGPTSCGNAITTSSQYISMTNNFWLEVGEECDDGNTISGDGCSAICELETCGDGICSIGEHPLDCSIDCPDPCGDGICGLGEDETICPIDCTPLCGNRVVDSGEECDSVANCLPYLETNACHCAPGYAPGSGNSCVLEPTIRTVGLSEISIVPTQTTYSLNKVISDNIEIYNTFGLYTSAPVTDYYLADYRAGCDDAHTYEASGTSCSAYSSGVVTCDITLDASFNYFDNLITYHGCAKIDGVWYTSPTEYLEVVSQCGDGKVSSSEQCDDGCNQGTAGVCEVGIDDNDGCTFECLLDSCGDGICSVGEHPSSCPIDCPNPCGDGVCGAAEDSPTCPIDCQPCDKDGICEPGEHYLECPDDCRGPSTCGNAITTSSQYFSMTNNFWLDLGEECDDGNTVSGDGCSAICELEDCGDGVCSLSEHPLSCSIDCPNPCGDGICGAGEDETICPIDCTPLCGNRVVDAGEECDSVANCLPYLETNACQCAPGYTPGPGNTCIPRVHINTTPLSENRSEPTHDTYQVNKVVTDYIVIHNRLGRSLDDYYLGDFRLDQPGADCSSYLPAQNTLCSALHSDLVECEITLDASFSFFDSTIKFYGCAEIDGQWYQSPAEYLLVETSCGDGVISGAEVCDDGALNGQPGYCQDCSQSCVIEDAVIALIDSDLNGFADPFETISISGDITSSDCSGATHIQVDASNADNSCRLAFSLAAAEMSGIYDSSMTILPGATSFSGSWAVPSFIPEECKGELITADYSALWIPDPEGALISPTIPARGSFTFANVVSSGPICGNGVHEATEDCDLTDDQNCPGLCTTSCSCPIRCPEGTRLCGDGECRTSCNDVCDYDNICDPTEGCTCPDCDGEPATCDVVGGFQGVCVDHECKVPNPELCPIGTRLCVNPVGGKYCKPGSCDDPTDERPCNNNDICDPFESCFCSDCYGLQDHCEPGLRCSDELICDVDPFGECPVGTRLCPDDTCASDCDPELSCDFDGICDIDESCACADCELKQDHCTPGLVCWNGVCSDPGPHCPSGTYLCADLTCSSDCDGPELGCENGIPDGICSIYEACDCPDCDGERAHCAIGLVCSNDVCDLPIEVPTPPPCPDGKSLCFDGTCREDCSPVGERECNYDGFCDASESCRCSDCYGKQDYCEVGLRCSSLTQTCSSAYCGNGVIDGNEMCDDANYNNNDFCIACSEAFCGDGYVHYGYEDCDDGLFNGFPGFCDVSCSQVKVGENLAEGQIIDQSGLLEKSRNYRNMIKFYLVTKEGRTTDVNTMLQGTKTEDHKDYLSPGSCLRSTKAGQTCIQKWYVQSNPVDDIEIFDLEEDIYVGSAVEYFPINPLSLFPHYTMDDVKDGMETYKGPEFSVRMIPEYKGSIPSGDGVIRGPSGNDITNWDYESNFEFNYFNRVASLYSGKWKCEVPYASDLQRRTCMPSDLLGLVEQPDPVGLGYSLGWKKVVPSHCELITPSENRINNRRSLSCQGDYSTNECWITGNRLACKDSIVESSFATVGSAGGLTVTFKKPIGQCLDIHSVELCQKRHSLHPITSCLTKVSIDGGRNYVTVDETCPSYWSSGEVCTDITSFVSDLTCDHFSEDIYSSGITIKSTFEKLGGNFDGILEHSGEDDQSIMRWDSMYLNIIYEKDQE